MIHIKFPPQIIKKYLFLFCLIFIVDNIVFAQSTSSPLQEMLQNESSIKSRESTVDINGIKYQKIEVENKIYYISLKGRKGEIPFLLCEKPKKLQTEHLIEGSLKVHRRKFLYFKALKESCETKKGQKKSTVALSPELGIYLPENNKSTIKNKKIGINPLDPSSINFTGDF